jgi:hypothetical protein
MFARLIFFIVDFGARKGLSTPLALGQDNMANLLPSNAPGARAYVAKPARTRGAPIS